MNRRRAALLVTLGLTPFLAFGATRVLLADDDETEVSSGTTTTTEPDASTTTEATTTTVAPTTTVAAVKLTPSSPLPSVPQPGEPVAASSPQELAGQLITAWRAIENAAPDVARQGHLYQVATRYLAAKPDLRDATYRLLRQEPIGSGETLDAQVRADVDAAVKLRQLVGKPRTSLPPWRIVEPAPADELLGHYKAAEAEFGVPWYYLASINLVESRMGRIRGTSEAGAQGPMQFLPSTWSQYGAGGDINSYKDAIAAAARYLKRNGAPDDMRNAVWNYNHSYLYVDAVLAYGDRMKADEAAYRSYYHWQVYYVTTAGDVWLPVGYGT